VAQLSVGEDLFSALAIIGLMTLFVVALAHSYHIYAKRKGVSESLNLALDILDQLRNEVLVRYDNNAFAGLINPEAFQELQDYCQISEKQGIGLRVEVRTLEGKLVLACGPEPNSIRRYFSPPCSVSLPVAIALSPSSRQLGELVVHVWR